MIARFIRVYGFDAYLNALWPTADRRIPAGLFLLLWAEVDAIETVEQIRQANGHAHGEALAKAGKSPQVKTATRRLLRRAFPVTVRPATGEPEPLNLVPPPPHP